MSENKTQEQPQESLDRRNFLKLGSASVMTAVAAAAGEGFTAKDVMAKTHDASPIQTNELFKPIPQRNLVLTRAYGKLDKHLSMLAYTKYKKQPPKPGVPGYSQLDFAAAVGGWSIMKTVAPFDSGGFGDHGITAWDKHDYKKAKNAYMFGSKSEANQAIKKVAQTYGAIACGITPRDKRWDYDGFFDPKKGDYGWDSFPFEPKSVIVLAVPMDYHTISASPAWTASSTTGAGYSKMILTAAGMAQFFRALGYSAIPAGNGLGNSVAYGYQAGLGEPGRNGQLILPKYGPRVRLCKVYTDFDAAEFDKPMTFGVASFCERCKLCADACPAKCISRDDKPSYEPTYSEDPNYTWNNQKGVYKYYSDSKKCFEFWAENGTECGNCIAACPYNKPDFWHHRLVDFMNTVVPGPIHSIMREMDGLFGYGKVGDPAKVKKFWSTVDI